MLYIIQSRAPISLSKGLTACSASTFYFIGTMYTYPFSVTNIWQQVLLMDILPYLLVADNVYMKNYSSIHLYCIIRSLMPYFCDRFVSSVNLLFWGLVSRVFSAVFRSIRQTFYRWAAFIDLDFLACNFLAMITSKLILPFVTLSKRSSRNSHHLILWCHYRLGNSQ